MNKIEATHIEEQYLIFGGMKEEKDPRLGLNYFGPYHYSNENISLEKIKLGIIGTKSNIVNAKKIVTIQPDIHNL